MPLLVAGLLARAGAARVGAAEGILVHDAHEFDSFFDAKPDWNDTVAPQVTKMMAWQREIREIFAPVHDWTETATLSMHMAIVTLMAESLREARRVIDLGCGTGALLAAFEEATQKAELVEGMEYAKDVAEKTRENMEVASEFFRWKGLAPAAEGALATSEEGILGGTTEGNALMFNADGASNLTYDVMNVGFALRYEEFPAAIWGALAVGGRLGAPLCDVPLQRDDGKCLAHYHVFKRTASDAELPGLDMLGPDHVVLDKQIRFIVVEVES